MAGDSGRAAVRAFIGPMQDAVDCVSKVKVITDAFKPVAEQEYYLALTKNEPCRVQVTSGGHLLLFINQRFKLVQAEGERGPWKVTTTKYRYAIAEGTEIISYHWHPGEQGWDAPHLHLNAGAGQFRPELQHSHIPTERVSLEDFLAFAIHDFHVKPNRTDHKRILEASKRKFTVWKRW